MVPLSVLDTSGTRKQAPLSKYLNYCSVKSNIDILIMDTVGNCDGNENDGDMVEHNGLRNFADCDDLRNFDSLRIVMIGYLL